MPHKLHITYLGDNILFTYKKVSFVQANFTSLSGRVLSGQASFLSYRSTGINPDKLFEVPAPYLAC